MAKKEVTRKTVYADEKMYQLLGGEDNFTRRVVWSAEVAHLCMQEAEKQLFEVLSDIELRSCVVANWSTALLIQSKSLRSENI